MLERKFKYKSAFDIIGPIMVGPSSSHTAGAVKIGNMAQKIYKKVPKKLVVTFFGSFAETYKGHGTAVAIVAGVLGFKTNDERIPDAIQLAEKEGIVIEFLVSEKATDHANTVNLELINDQARMNLTAISIGGGSIQLTELDSCKTSVADAEYNGLIITINQSASVIEQLKNALENPIVTKVHTVDVENIYFVETLSDVSQNLLKKINEIPGITAVIPTTG